MSKNKVNFTVIYDGPALQQNRMDVNYLIPALIALTNLVVNANKALNGDSATVTVNVQTFKNGSFGISLEMVQSVIASVKNFLGIESVHDALSILDALGFSVKDALAGGAGLFALIIFSKGRKPKKCEKGKDGNVRFEFDDNGKLREISVPSDVATLFVDNSVRAQASKVLEPLKMTSGKIDKLLIERDNEKQVLATYEDSGFFDDCVNWQDNIESSESCEQRLLAISSLSFKRGNKWRFSDGENTFSAAIMDNAFMQKVEMGLPFSKGDMLKVELRTKTQYSEFHLTTEYEIIKVIKIIHKNHQLQLPLETEK